MSENPLIIFGLEGTAWNLSAALVNEEGVIYEKSATYTPAIGGIHPREASQHHAEFMAQSGRRCSGPSPHRRLEIGCHCFLPGSGPGPCLRTVATAARALSLRFGIPLVGVNHCVAHIEVGKWQSGARDPARDLRQRGQYASSRPAPGSLQDFWRDSGHSVGTP